MVVHVDLLQRGRQVLSQIMHLMDTLGILEYSNSKWLHDIIVNVFHMILKVVPDWFQMTLYTSFTYALEKFK